MALNSLGRALDQIVEIFRREIKINRIDMLLVYVCVFVFMNAKIDSSLLGTSLEFNIENSIKYSAFPYIFLGAKHTTQLAYAMNFKDLSIYRNVLTD